MAAEAATPRDGTATRSVRELREVAASLPERIMFFDGVCAFCNDAVRRLLDRDPEGRIHFAPLQGETAAALRAADERFPALEDLDTFAFFDQSAGPISIETRSAATFALMEVLGGSYRRWLWLRALPRWLTNLAYRAFASNRYRLFGRLEACSIPDEADRARILP